MAPEFLNALKAADWRGNIRELRNVIERSMIVCDKQLTLQDLPIEIQNTRQEDYSGKNYSEFELAAMEKRHIAKVLGLETVFVAVIAIVCGILSGIVFSKLILMLLYRMLGFQESVSFFIAKAGIRKAILIFGVLYLLTLLYNLLQIRLANPIELLRGGNSRGKRAKDKGRDGSSRSSVSGGGVLYCNYHTEPDRGIIQVFPCGCPCHCRNVFPVHRRKHCHF